MRQQNERNGATKRREEGDKKCRVAKERQEDLKNGGKEITKKKKKKPVANNEVNYDKQNVG